MATPKITTTKAKGGRSAATPKKPKQADRPATPPADLPPATPVAGEPTATEPTPADQPAAEQAPPLVPEIPEPAPTKQPRARPPRPAAGAGREKALSALDAAAKVLGETGQPMTCRQLIAAMAAQGYWSSPKGKTPQATLYAAITRETTTKGAGARFRKVGPGQFAATGTA